MLKILIPSKKSIHFYFENEDIFVMKNIFIKKNGRIEIDFNSFVEINFFNSTEDEECINFEGNKKINIYMCDDAFEVGLDKFDEFISVGYFSTPEFCEFELIPRKKNKIIVGIYFHRWIQP